VDRVLISPIQKRDIEYMSTSLHALTLDQLRLLVAVSDEGSFSAAGRHLHRAQSAVSYGIGNLEELLGVQLFERTGRLPRLTKAGNALLQEARKVLAQVSELQARAAQVSGVLEPDVSVVVDAIFPGELLIELCLGFQERFPSVPLRIHTEVLQGVAALVLNGTCQIGLSGPIGSESDQLHRRYLARLALVPVVASNHPLAALTGSISTASLREHVQIVISERAVRDDSEDHHVLSEVTWRVADASTKLSLISAGLGWGNLPFGMVAAAVETGMLKRLLLEESGPEPLMASLYTITRHDAPPGPAGQGLLEYLHELCRDAGPLQCPSEAIGDT
jgi:DNA-binding transcriptional LysR family regulator